MLSAKGCEWGDLRILGGSGVFVAECDVPKLLLMLGAPQDLKMFEQRTVKQTMPRRRNN